MASTVIPEPAASVPVTAEIRFQLRNDDDVIGPGFDGRRASRAHGPFPRCVWLDGEDSFVHPKNPQARAMATRTSAPTTMPMSAADGCDLRNGLKPMGRQSRRFEIDAITGDRFPRSAFRSGR